MLSTTWLFATERDTRCAERRKMKHDDLRVIACLSFFLGVVKEDCSENFGMLIGEADEVFCCQAIDIKCYLRRFVCSLINDNFFTGSNKVEQRHTMAFLIIILILTSYHFD